MFLTPDLISCTCKNEPPAPPPNCYPFTENYNPFSVSCTDYNSGGIRWIDAFNDENIWLNSRLDTDKNSDLVVGTQQGDICKETLSNGIEIDYSVMAD